MSNLVKHEPEPIQTSYLEVIDRAARDPSTDIQKMQGLLDMQLQLMAIESHKRYNDAMRVVQGLIPAVVKDSMNPQTNSAYVKLDKIQEVVTPIILEHGFALSFGTDKSELPDHYGVTAQLSHKDGHTQHFRADVPIDNLGPKGLPNKTKTHGFGSAISYGQRYLTKLIFNIRLIGEDDDGNKGNRPKAQTPATNQDPTLKALVVELWNLTKPIGGDKHDWAARNAWFYKNSLLDGAEEPLKAAPHLSAEVLRVIISKAKGLL